MFSGGTFAGETSARGTFADTMVRPLRTFKRQQHGAATGGMLVKNVTKSISPLLTDLFFFDVPVCLEYKIFNVS